MWGVYGQLFNADGTKSGSEFQVNTYITGSQLDSSVASLSNGQFVVTWQSFGQDGDRNGVYGQIFESSIPTTSTSSTTSSRTTSTTTTLSTSSTTTSSSSTESSSSFSSSLPPSSSSLLPISSSSIIQSKSATNEVISGVERQTGIALTALRGITQTIKGALGY